MLAITVAFHTVAIVALIVAVVKINNSQAHLMRCVSKFTQGLVDLLDAVLDPIVETTDETNEGE